MNTEELKVGDLVYCENKECINDDGYYSPCIAMAIKKRSRIVFKIIKCESKEVVGEVCGLVKDALNEGMAYLI